MRRITTVGLSAMLLATLALPAMAGGWWTSPQLEQPTLTLGIGETTTVRARVMFSTAEEAVTARTEGAWYAYLVRGIDTTGLQEAMTGPQPSDWWTTPQETIQLGLLRFGPNDSNLAHASVTFVVPDMEAGAYDLMFCNRGCSEPLADVVPLQFIYVGDLATVGMIRASQIPSDQLMGELERVGSNLYQVNTAVGAMGESLDELRGRIDQMDASVDATQTFLAAAEQQPDGRADSTASLLTWAGWIVAVVAAAWGWSTRRRGVTDKTETSELEADTQIMSGEVPAEPEFVTRS